MKKSILLFICLLLAAAPLLNAETVATGAAAPPIPATEWLDSKPHSIAEFKGKKVVVLVLWNLDNSGLAVVQMMNRMAKLFPAKDVSCLAVANGGKLELLKFPGVQQLPFPVCADEKQETAKMYQRSYDRLPMAVVIGRDGKVNWRGDIRQVPAVVKRILTGKFDLNSQIHAEKFSTALKSAVLKKDFQTADKLVRAEWKRTPENLELLSMLLVINFRHLKKVDEAFKLIQEANRILPNNSQVAELEIRLIVNSGQSKKYLDGFAKRAIAQFGSDPAVMKKMAARTAELKAADIDLLHVHRFMQAAWHNGKFANLDAKADFALEYARMLHNFCRPDLSYKLALWAEQNCSKSAKAGASAAATYYCKLMQSSAKMEL